MEPLEVHVPRDYAHGLEPTRFERAIPRELERRVAEHDFLVFVDAVNALFADAERVGWHTALEDVLGCLSCFTLSLCYDTTYKKAMRRLEALVHSHNATVFLPRGVRVRNPLFNGLLYIEFLVYPPPHDRGA